MTQVGASPPDAPGRQALPPEARLLLCWAPTRPSAASLAQADRLLDERIDWARFSRYALRHAIAPRVHLRVEEMDDPRIPSEARDGLAILHHANAVRNLRMAGELQLLITDIESRGVQVASLKGPLLAEEAEGSLALRMISDLDLLVRPHDVPAVRRCLEERDFVLQQELVFAPYHDVFSRPSDLARVEIHIRLDVPWLPLPLPLDQILQRLERRRLLGASIPCLPIEENLLFLCYHGAKHRWSRIAWLTDFLGLLERRRTEIDMQHFCARSDAIGMGRALASALRLASDFLDLRPALPAMRAFGSDPRVARFAAESMDAAFAEKRGPTGDTTPERARTLFVLAAGLLDPGSHPKERRASDAALLRMGLHLSDEPTIFQAFAVYRVLRGSRVRNLVNYLFSPTQLETRVFGVSHRRRLFYAVARPLSLATRLIGYGLRRVLKLANRPS